MVDLGPFGNPLLDEGNFASGKWCPGFFRGHARDIGGFENIDQVAFVRLTVDDGIFFGATLTQGFDFSHIEFALGVF